MPVKPSDFSLSPEQLSQRYTAIELEETLRLLQEHGESQYVNDFVNITARDPGKMDMFSSEYGTELASNILPSTLTLFTGLADMIFSPIDTAKAIYEVGLDGTVEMLKEQYGSWENIKRTIAEDPMGQATMIAPGFGALGKVKALQGAGRAAMAGASKVNQRLPKSIQPLGGLIKDVGAGVAKPAYDLVVNPVEAIGSVALRGASSLMRFQGELGRVALEFVTGESMQSLEAMQRVGRLTDKQIRIAGINPLHWIGRIADPETLAEFGETGYTQFKRGRQLGKDVVGGFKDESAIVGHINQIVEDFGNKLVQESDLLMEDIFQAWANNIADPGAKISNSLPLGDPAIANVLLTKLNDKVKHLNIEFIRDEVSGRHHHKPIGTGKFLVGTGADQVIKWITNTLDTKMERLQNIKDAFIGHGAKQFAGQGEQAGVLQQLVAQTGKSGNIDLVEAFYDSMREYTDSIMPEQYTKALNSLMPESGNLRKLLENPDSGDSQWAEILHHQKLKVNLENNYAAMKSGDAPDEVATLSAYIRALQSDPVRKQMVDELEMITGESIHAAISGLISRKLTPSSLIARGSAVSAMQRAAAGATAAAVFNPMFLFFIPFSSPRFVGSVLSTIGLSQRSGDYVKALVRHMGQHKIGKRLREHNSTIWSVGTVLEQIQKYNAMYQSQPEDRF